jgi:regulator of sigma E protease
MFIFDFILFVLVLGVIILIHELGHFYFAKKAGILCHEFSIGMGPALYQKRKGETIYSIRGIPIGGYVAMAGESVNDALIRKEQVIGVKLNQQGQVNEIILNSELDKDFVGIVKSFDLYGKEFNPLFIELDINGELKKFFVLRDAIYKMSETKEMWITPSEKSFESKTLWQRFLVIFAGPLMNFILAFFLFFIVAFFILKPNLETGNIGVVSEKSAAETLGLLEGDIIISINDTMINEWMDVSLAMGMLDRSKIDLVYQRNGINYTELDLDIAVFIQTAGITNVTEDGTIYSDEAKIGQAFGRAKQNGLDNNDVIKSINGEVITSWDDVILFFNNNDSGNLVINYQRGLESLTVEYEMISERALGKLGYQAMIFQLGVSPESNFDILYTLSYPFKAFQSNVMQVFNTLGLLFDRQENIGVGDLSGPVGIFSLVSQTRAQGFISILAFTAFLSINIGLLNLMPIPALDGGRLVFLGLEFVTKKPLNRKLENTINNVMFFILIGLFIFVTYNDILRLIRG